MPQMARMVHLRPGDVTVSATALSPSRPLLPLMVMILLEVVVPQGGQAGSPPRQGHQDPPGPGAGTASGVDEPLQETFLARLNEERAAQGAAPLRLVPLLSQVAMERAREVASHGGLEGEEPLTAEDLLERLARAGYRAQSATEVMAQATGPPETVLAVWKWESPETFEPLLDRDFRDLGIAMDWPGEVPLYVLVVALSKEDFFREKTAALVDLEEVRWQMLELVNTRRREAGLAPLRLHPLLHRAAQSHAEDMLARSYYGHQSPEGRTVRERLEAVGYLVRFAAENLALGHHSVEEVMAGWMGSEIHRRNLLSRRFTELGIGLAYGKNDRGYQILWVQNFARPRD